MVVVAECALSCQDLYENHFPAEVFSAFDRLQGFARELNSRLTFPEFVMLGAKGVGKTSVIEGLVGAPLMGAGMTNRPVHLCFVNNPARETPRIVLKRDPLLKEFNYDIEGKFLCFCVFLSF